MNFEAVKKIANAVLYEGYILYPYRPSSLKNRQRWNFGTLYPQGFAEAQRPPEAFAFTAETLIEAGPEATLDLCVRFLQLANGTDGSGWAEGKERNVERNGIRVRDLIQQPMSFTLTVDGPYRVVATLSLSAHPTPGESVKLHIELSNITDADVTSREAALLYSFTSAHLLLGVANGEFISLLDPPQQHRSAATTCHNAGVFPVLVGDAARRDMMLCSPIILYDYPQVAPESRGDFFDATEMDEMLSLRLLTMTEEEKAEARLGDSRAREVLERTETLPSEHLMKLHGAIRGLRPVPTREDK